VSFANTFVAVLLRSPAHRFLSGSTDLIRYVGARSGRTFTTPTQYVLDRDDLIIMVGRPETKSWWRNFVTPHNIDVLVRGRWISMVGEVVDGVAQPEHAARLVDIYVAHSPRAVRTLGGGVRVEQVRGAVFVVCRRPRST